MAAAGLWLPAEPEPLMRIEGQRLILNFHEGQSEAWAATERTVAIVAGSQAGKTSFGPHWLHREMRECGPGDYIVVTPTVPLLKLKALPEFLTLFRDHYHLGVWKASDHVFYVQDGSRVIFGSASNPESLESATAKAAWLDECGQDRFSLSAYEAVNRRVALHRGRKLLTTTPYNMGWLKTHIWDPWEKRTDRNIKVVSFTSLMNPIFPREEYEEARRKLPGWKFAMFHQGRFTRPAGLIYGDFDARQVEDGGHLVRPFQIPPHWPRYGSFDFGAVNTARLIAAENPDTGTLIVYLEALDGEMTTSEHARAAIAAVDGTNMQTWWGGSPSETQQRMDYTGAGVRILPPPVGDVESGINAVIEYLRTRRIRFFEDLEHLLDEFERYKREVDPETGVTGEKIVAKETFHILDALRYLILGHRHHVPLAAPLGLERGGGGEEWALPGGSGEPGGGNDPTRDDGSVSADRNWGPLAPPPSGWSNFLGQN